jgi:hypothetical protein
MLTESSLWRSVVAAWPPPRNTASLAGKPPEEVRRILTQPYPDLTGLVDAAQAGDMSELCRTVARNVAPDALIAQGVLRQVAERRAELVTDDIGSEWFKALAEAHAPALERWRGENTDANLSAVYHQFLNQVPPGVVSFDELLAVLDEPSDEKVERGEYSRWATYLADELALQIWADPRGRYCADKLA